MPFGIHQLLKLQLKILKNYKLHRDKNTASRLTHLMSDLRIRAPCFDSHFRAFESKNFFI